MEMNHWWSNSRKKRFKKITIRSRCWATKLDKERWYFFRVEQCVTLRPFLIKNWLLAHNTPAWLCNLISADTLNLMAVAFKTIAINYVVSSKRLRDFVYKYNGNVGLLSNSFGFYMTKAIEKPKTFDRDTM